MNKFSILLFVFLLGIFGGIFYFLQGDVFKKTASNTSLVPTFPPDDELFDTTKSDSQLQDQHTATAQTQQQSAGAATAPTFGVEEGVKASYSAVIKTNKGAITLRLNGKAAPNTVKNFITKVKSGFYTGLTFHRVEDWVIQGGDPKGDGTGGGLMQTEINDVPFGIGSLGVARGGNINVSNDSQFFITKSEASWLNQQYTNFGEVTDGMDVVNKIAIGDKIISISIE
jgi:peptidyl-prolyl cis-trans isomerase B (cyclophilin B)